MCNYGQLIAANPWAFPVVFDALRLWAQHLAQGAVLQAEMAQGLQGEGVAWAGNPNSYWGGYYWDLPNGSWRGVFLVYQWQPDEPADISSRTYTPSDGGWYSAYIEEKEGAPTNNVGTLVQLLSIEKFAQILRALPPPLGGLPPAVPLSASLSRFAAGSIDGERCEATPVDGKSTHAAA